MGKRVAFVVAFLVNSYYCTDIWEKLANDCPKICTCQTQHITETAIYRFMQKEKGKPMPGEAGTSIENNEVLYDDDFEFHLQDPSIKAIVRSATCILQTETEPQDLLESLPSTIDSLTLIQGYESGNKTILFSYLTKFSDLRSLEIMGPNLFKKPTNSHLLCEIDDSLPELRYMNLERIFIRSSKRQTEEFLKQVVDEKITFEYVQKLDENSHPLTLVQKSSDDEIVPYSVFQEQRRINGDVPLFIGFKNLVLLRITNCELNSIHWEMFEGLSELHYLILEKNNLRFIPSFAFYGTPNLKTLSLAHNKLLDIQITDLAGLLKLEYLDLSYNNFSQLSELTLPPFPNLKLANFANNPIGIVFPNTFEVINTTDSLIIGSNDMPVTLMPNSFLGLNLLKTLTLNNLNIDILKKGFFVGMPKLQELILSGNISKIEYDAFLEIPNLKKLILSNCKTYNVSMDAFIGLEKLEYLDLSHNLLEYLPPGVFDCLTNIKELYLNGNKLQQLPRDIFSKIHAKLIRLNDNPWHCSCEMSEWKPLIINRIKQKVLKHCDYSLDKGIGCALEDRYEIKYQFDAKIAPKCTQPRKTINWNIFHAMRSVFKCTDFKPKIKKRPKTSHMHYTRSNSTNNVQSVSAETSSQSTSQEYNKLKLLKLKNKKNRLNNRLNKNNLIKLTTTTMSNELNDITINNYKDNKIKNNVKPDINNII